MPLMKRTIALVGLIALPVLWGPLSRGGDRPAETTNSAPARVVTTSASGRFVVAGPDAVANSQYTRWAEDTATRLERLLGVTFIPVKRVPTVRIVLLTGTPSGAAIEVQRRRVNGFVERELRVNDALSPDYEWLQARLCELLVDSCLDSRRRGSGPETDAGTVPQWLTMGLAQNLAAETRVRNRRIVTRWMTPPVCPRLTEILQWYTLPEGWPRYRALCGMAVYWMGTLREGGQVYADMLDRLAANQPLTVNWVAAQAAHPGSPAAMEQAWQDWLARQGQAIQDFGELSSALLDQLKAEVDLNVPLGTGSLAGVTRRLAPADVIAERERLPQVALAAAEKIHGIRRLTLGKAPEFVEIGEAYGSFYSAVARGAWTMTLRIRLARAEAAFDRLDKLTRAREAYLDEAEREAAEGDGRDNTAGVGPAEPVLEKSRIQAYLDDAEARFGSSHK